MSAFTNLRKFLTSTLKGPFINALLESLAEGDGLNEFNVQAAKEQLFIATAQGQFLDKLLAGIGIIRPPGVGIDDDLLREIAIKQTNSKLVSNIFLDVLEIFYGEDAVRANVRSSAPEKYVLQEGMTLILKLDGADKPVTITFKSSDFTDIGLATAAEVANAISNQAFNQGFTLTASSELDNETGLNFVQLLSGTKGPKSSIQVIGGSAQNILKFPAQKDAVPKIGTQFTTSFSGPYVRYTWTGGLDPGLGLVDAGDYVTIYGTGYLPSNRGSFEIQNVQGGSLGNAYFEILNPIFKPQAAVTLTQVTGASGNGKIYRVLNIADSPIGCVRSSNVVTVTTTTNHGLSTGQQVSIREVSNAAFNGTFTITVLTPTTFTYNQSGPNATSGTGTVLHQASITSPSVGAVRSAGNSTLTTSSPHFFQVGQLVTVEGVEDSSFNGSFTVTSTTTNTIQYLQNYSNDVVFYKPTINNLQKLPRYASVYEVNPYEVVIFLPATTKIVKRELIGAWHVHDLQSNRDFIGSYTFDTKTRLPIGQTSANLQSAPINQGEIKTVIQASNTSNFPDAEGFLYFGFGTSNEEGPVRYLSRPSNNSLLIDPSYKFKNTHDIGTDISLILDRAPYQPDPLGNDYQTFLTGTVVGRIEAQKLIAALAASGVFLNIIIVYPQAKGIDQTLNESFVYGADPE